MSDIVGNTGTPDYTGEKVTLTAFRGPASQIPPSSRRQSLALLRKEPCGNFCHHIVNLNPPVYRSPAVAASSERVVVPRNPAIDNTSLGPPTPPPRFASRRKLPVDYLRPRDSASPPNQIQKSENTTGGVCQKPDCQSQLLVVCELFRKWRDLAVTERSYQQQKAGGILRGQLQLQATIRA
ncbi:hypothetical protein An09g04720 [Aspergillus niger]|uniref:Uncharacterized protein n=2 Tax=Aspergillus niger TaxID=5061 RepID=A2QU83_ASPNC|nr:hypothetical protein An09g04720 [Aspergillus niger]CAK40326.1 hypothetical protein An09g04720 [Aspergillus niger]